MHKVVHCHVFCLFHNLYLCVVLLWKLGRLGLERSIQIPEQNNVFLLLPELDVHKNRNIFINPLIFIKKRFPTRLFIFGISKKMREKKMFSISLRKPRRPKISLDIKMLWGLKKQFLVTLLTWMILGINEDVTHVTNFFSKGLVTLVI